MEDNKKTDSSVIFSCRGLGGSNEEAKITNKALGEAKQAIETAVDSGITLFDHAGIYNRGKAETVFGMVLKDTPSLQNMLRIQTKVGICPISGPAGFNTYNWSRSYLLQSVENSLRRLGVEHLERVLLQGADVLFEPEEVADAFRIMKERGWVEEFGVCNISVNRIRFLNSYVDQPLRVNQLSLSLGNTRIIEEGLLENCRLSNIKVQTVGSLDGGLFTSGLREGLTEAQQKTSAAVEEIAIAKESSREAVVLAWLMRIAGSVQPVISTTDPSRIRASSQAERVELSREEWYRLWILTRGGHLP